MFPAGSLMDSRRGGYTNSNGWGQKSEKGPGRAGGAGTMTWDRM